MEMDAIRALIISLCAGMSTLLGALVIMVVKKSEKLVSVSLGFAAGIMISVSLTDLYPNAVDNISQKSGQPWGILFSVAGLLLGMLLAGMLDHFVPHQAYDQETGETPHKNLFHVGFVSMLALGLHNFPEGIATFMAGYENLTLGISIAVAIAFHNIPEGIAVAMPIYFSTNSKRKAFQYTFLSGIAEPIGALLAFLVLRPFMNATLLGVVFAVVAGIMIYIAIEELIPSSRQYGHDRMALIATLTGVCIMPLTQMIH